ncbi:fungal-specific transcription factor domain-containing protein [Cercophora samala]|uniref:Fungal-specific transcription factor domain-containing protein n=1 Tax=Cercophora samala TaxID=330535 RepID=A0AA39ZDY7_9PEZI|nr:fungal-specific transcription factor domain-containing protein [Cercophora samala]
MANNSLTQSEWFTTPASNLNVLDEAEQSQAQPKTRKRTRISVACKTCRTRKSRCDGRLPCSTCSDVGLVCEYDDPCYKPAQDKDVSQLEERLRVLEQQLVALQEKDRQSETLQVTSPSASRLDDRSWQCDASTSGTSPIEDEGDVVDGMGAVSLREDLAEQEYIGPSSNVAFLRFIMRTLGGSSIRNTLGNSSSGHEGARRSRSGTFVSSRPIVRGNNAFPKKPVDVYVLPALDQAEQLLHLYFNTVNLMIPCIHEDRFRSIWSIARSGGPGNVSRPWLGIINMVFALAANVVGVRSPPQDRAALSDMCFQRALELVKPYMLGNPSLELVQLFLLMVIYLEGTSYSSLAWTFHSLAVKGSYQLGLHVTGCHNLSPLDAEIRRRQWYWCVMNDRVTYGRPPLIPLAHVNPKPGAQIAFSNVSSSVTSFHSFSANVRTRSVTHLMGDILERLYDNNLGTGTNPEPSQVLEQTTKLCFKLARWQDDLPANLKIMTFHDTIDVVAPPMLESMRLRVLLSLRYLGIRILAMRPVLNLFLDTTGLEPYAHEHTSRWLHSCGATILSDLVRTAGDVIHISRELLRASETTKQNLLGAWWFSCYYTFNASLALLGVIVIKRMPLENSTVLSAISTAELRKMMDTALEILHGLDGGNETITRCRDALSQMLKAVDSTGQSGTSDLVDFSPSGAWAAQLMDSGIFSSELTMGVGPDMFGAGFDDNQTFFDGR